MPFAQNLRTARTAAHLSQAQLAAAVHVSPGLIGQMETGIRGCSPTLLQAISNALGTIPDTLASPDERHPRTGAVLSPILPNSPARKTSAATHAAKVASRRALLASKYHTVSNRYRQQFINQCWLMDLTCNMSDQEVRRMHAGSRFFHCLKELNLSHQDAAISLAIPQDLIPKLIDGSYNPPISLAYKIERLTYAIQNPSHYCTIDLWDVAIQRAHSRILINPSGYSVPLDDDIAMKAFHDAISERRETQPKEKSTPRPTPNHGRRRRPPTPPTDRG